MTDKPIAEDAPTNSVSGGAVAGVGVGPQGEPGVKRKSKKQIVMDTLKRK